MSEEDLTFFVAMMISTAHIKRHVSTPKRKRAQTDFMSVIYSYSTKNMMRLSKNKAFQFLFEEFINSSRFDSFMKSDKTLSRHPGLFKQTASSIINMWKH